MVPNYQKHTVLVPILGDDISEDVYTKARALLREPESRLVLLHVRPPADVAVTASCTTSPNVEPRWHRLASALPADRTFIDAVEGDPTAEIVAEADRFHSDAILF
jgi:hypothetical protein